MPEGLSNLGMLIWVVQIHKTGVEDLMTIYQFIVMDMSMLALSHRALKVTVESEHEEQDAGPAFNLQSAGPSGD